MPISSIAQLILRLFALIWVVKGLPMLAGVIAMGSDYFGLAKLLMVPSATNLFFGVLMWVLAPGLARLIARNNNREVTLAGITAQQLYTAVLIGLGLYFALSSFSDALTKLQILTLPLPPSKDAVNPRVTGLELGSSLLICLLGVRLVLTAGRWGTRLAGKSASSGWEGLQNRENRSQ